MSEARRSWRVQRVDDYWRGSNAYLDGCPVTIIYVPNAVGFLLNVAYCGPQFRQPRVVMASRRSASNSAPVNEHVFTWLQIPPSTLQVAI